MNNIELNKLYLHIDENNYITKYFIKYCDNPYRAEGCEFDESKDFENAILTNISTTENIIIGISKYINGEIVNE